MNKHQIIVKALSELEEAAKTLLSAYPERRVFAFNGSMGAGKTTFITVICKLLGIEKSVSSPTFALINEYFCKTYGSVYHFDLYRLNNEEELFHIGAEEYFYSGNYCFVEWPEQAKQLLPENTVYVGIEEVDDDCRLIEF